MSGFLKQIFDLTTSQFSVSNNVLVDYIAMAIILFIGFKIAFGIVGDLYHADIIHGKAIGSVLHWSIRLGIVYIMVKLISNS